MSCQTCGGCFTGSGCTTTKPSKIKHDQHENRVLGLLKLAGQKDDKPSDDHDHVIPTLVAELSRNVYASQMALLSAYNQLPLTDFLELARCCCAHDMIGVHIAWAWEYCHGMPTDLLHVLKDQAKREELWDYLDGQAEVHEVLSQLPDGAAGRIKRSST
ncbi:hypothetical protein EC973_007727 [Apophysomyces ossiformis]|uniref:Uncharacterized protein n=1 Tax=Apophysomyces ossiformis TaxID=679940 RepID=A0A8H7ETZ2_9FUNG|nr:hypothetical protein EC973_007727 [Apophysomyces ossiformis]